MKLRVEHDGVCKTYAMLYHVAGHLLDFAKVHAEGSLLQLQASVVFHAFTFEAYLNHLGFTEIPFWDDIERIPYKNKLRVLAGHLGVDIRQGCRPFQTIWELFDLRDRLAHGRTVEIRDSYETTQDPPHDSSWRVLPWEKLTTDSLDRFRLDLKSAIETLNAARKNPDMLLWSEGIRGKTVTVIAP